MHHTGSNALREYSMYLLVMKLIEDGISPEQIFDDQYRVNTLSLLFDDQLQLLTNRVYNRDVVKIIDDMLIILYNNYDCREKNIFLSRYAGHRMYSDPGGYWTGDYGALFRWRPV